MQWQPLELSEQDKAFLEYMEEVQKSIASIFAIPEYTIGTTDDNNVELEHDMACKKLKEMMGIHG